VCQRLNGLQRDVLQDALIIAESELEQFSALVQMPNSVIGDIGTASQQAHWRQ
jgi:hypothetical protein